MDVDTGGEERITYHEGFDGLPVFSPDGKRLMWTSSGRTADRKSQLFIADFTPGTRGRRRAGGGTLIVCVHRDESGSHSTEGERRDTWDPRTSSATRST